MSIRSHPNPSQYNWRPNVRTQPTATE
jgi:hypothetical protein